MLHTDFDYTGIGSRKTPYAIQDDMERIAQFLGAQGCWLRSGGAEGADTAFQLGAPLYKLYLPWEDFNCNVGYCPPQPAAYELARAYHPAWGQLSDAARALHARNAHQIFDVDLRSPTKFVICWTKNGSLTGKERDTGGTGTALRIASAFGIPVFNLARPEHHRFWTSLLISK